MSNIEQKEVSAAEQDRIVAKYLSPDTLPADGQPIFVLIAGPVAVGKTELRRRDYSTGFVILDAAEMFLDLCAGQYYDFPSVFENALDMIGSRICDRAFAEKRNIVCEVVGDDGTFLIALVELVKLAGYQVQVINVACDFEESARRNLSRGDDDISSYYAQGFHLRWMSDVFVAMRATSAV